MTAFVLFSVPSKESKIKRITQNAIMDMTLGNRLSGFRAYDLPQVCKGTIAVRIKLKDALHYFGIVGMNFNVALKLVVAVTKRCASRIDALCCFLLHALSDFLAQVLNVVAGHENLKTVHQFRLRLGILVEYLTLFSEMDFYA